MQRIQFGASESLGRVALRGGVGGTFQFTAPRFGPRCVCCNANAMGRTQDYDPSTDRVQAASVAMPVCFDCSDHALQTALVPILQACLLIVGISLTSLGIMYATERPSDQFLYGMIAVGGLMVVAAVSWIVSTSRKLKREQVAGHHPRLVFSVAHGRTVLVTRNDTLAAELLELNANARRLPDPLLWRLRRDRQLPVARAVQLPVRDDEAARLAEYLARPSTDSRSKPKP